VFLPKRKKPSISKASEDGTMSIQKMSKTNNRDEDLPSLVCTIEDVVGLPMRSRFLSFLIFSACSSFFCLQ